MIARVRKSPKQMLEDLYKKYGRFFTNRVDFHLEPAQKINALEKLLRYDFKEFAGKKVLAVNRADGVKILLEDNTWVMFRVSGTEPMVRCYCEAFSQRSLKNIERAGRAFIMGDNE
jgi:phosphoglucomutase